ncbi:exodeoxyribonuclease III [Nakamurella deserti]|uniref:exodeoxyribonuclease III n=1 Tax=Nakamurella deserti TaxID=2164074 RepID=UPI001478E772|nr:exodeoxyribonuclease III [Nakamurella deserti]
MAPPRRIASVNVNGIRAAVRRGYVGWQTATAPDVVCLQEVRSPLAAIPPEAVDGYHLSYHEGHQPGRAGVAVLSRDEPSDVRVGFGTPGSSEFDRQGRYLEVDLPGLTVASLYLPKGDKAGPVLDNKLAFMTEFAAHVTRRAASSVAAGREFLVCGDYNIAETTADLRWWKRYQKAPGFLPVERAWLAALQSSAGLVDVLRRLHPDQDGPYTWWSWRTSAWDADAGWRIDHHLATPGLAARAVRGRVDREASFDARISDHAPVVVDYAG